MTIQTKVWGTTQQIFKNATSETHYLNICPGGYCSEHKHEHKHNRFFVISGNLVVTVFHDDLGMECLVKPGEFLDVPCGLYHKFHAPIRVTCLETYWVDEINQDDIERRTQGGI